MNSSSAIRYSGQDALAREKVSRTLHDLLGPISGPRAVMEYLATSENILGPQRELLHRASAQLERIAHNFEMFATLTLTSTLDESWPFDPVSAVREAVAHVNALEAGTPVRIDVGIHVPVLVRGNQSLFTGAVSAAVLSAKRAPGQSSVRVSILQSPATHLSIHVAWDRKSEDAAAPHGVELDLAERVFRVHGGDLSVSAGAMKATIPMAGPAEVQSR